MADAMRAAPVTAIVLNWCAEADTTACVRSLLASDHPALTVLIVDNGSPDGSGARLHAAFPEVPYLQTGANLGFTGGNNRGIAWAMERGAEWVLLVNDDATVAPDCVSRLLAAAQSRPRVAGVSPTITYKVRPDLVWFGGGDFSPKRAMGRHRHEGRPLAAVAADGPVEISFMTGCVCLVSVAALREVGALAEDYFAYVEDAELSLRLVRAGWTLLHEPRARAGHDIALDSHVESSPWQIVQRDRNRRRLARRHYGAAERLRFLAWFGATRLVHLARFVVRGDLARARAIVTGMVTP